MQGLDWVVSVACRRKARENRLDKVLQSRRAGARSQKETDADVVSHSFENKVNRSG